MEKSASVSRPNCLCQSEYRTRTPHFRGLHQNLHFHHTQAAAVHAFIFEFAKYFRDLLHNCLWLNQLCFPNVHEKKKESGSFSNAF